MKLVIDASVAVAAAGNPVGFERFRRYELIAPPLMWLEAASVLHAMCWRGELERRQGEAVRDRVLAAPVHRDEPRDLALRAWGLADQMGWARTYDANYVALAKARGCQLVTLDARLRRGAARLGLVVGPTEL